MLLRELWVRWTYIPIVVIGVTSCLFLCALSTRSHSLDLTLFPFLNYWAFLVVLTSAWDSGDVLLLFVAGLTCVLVFCLQIANSTERNYWRAKEKSPCVVHFLERFYRTKYLSELKFFSFPLRDPSTRSHYFPVKEANRGFSTADVDTVIHTQWNVQTAAGFY